jgi:hypothetical protein
MSAIVAITAIVALVSIVAIVFGRSFSGRVNRSSIVIDVDERTERKDRTK